MAAVDPTSWSQLVLDETFDPAPVDAQQSLLDFCTQLDELEWVKPGQGDTCIMREFEQWLVGNAASDKPDEAYSLNCVGASGLPIRSESFDTCMIAWSKLIKRKSVISRNGKVEILIFSFNTYHSIVSPYEDLDKLWHQMSDFETDFNNRAAPSVSRSFFSSRILWWYDSSGQTVYTAYAGSAIALAAAFIVVLLSSRSLLLTILSTLTILCVLVSVSAILVGLGWSLGFVEAICFSVVIGLSVDYVIHFGHAWSFLPGNVRREDRTKYALITMGPSILASACTTMISATFGFFGVIAFFQKFSEILLFTVLQATLCSFLFFLALLACFGPAEPTATADKIANRVSWCRQSKHWEEESGVHDEPLNETEGTEDDGREFEEFDV